MKQMTAVPNASALPAVPAKGWSFGLLLLAGALLFAGRGEAGDEALYGPAAPPDSAFVRLFNASSQPGVEARVADKVLLDIGPNQASEFVFLPPGSYTLTVGGKSQDVNLQKNRFYTAVLGREALNVLSVDRHANRLKTLLMLYNLVDGTQLNLRTADGRTVIEPVAPQNLGSRTVNAVRVDLALYDGDKRLMALKPVNLERGRAFSLFVSGTPANPVTSWVMN